MAMGRRCDMDPRGRKTYKSRSSIVAITSLSLGRTKYAPVPDSTASHVPTLIRTARLYRVGALENKPGAACLPEHVSR